MKLKKQLVFYIILIVLMLLAVYSIFNAGNPNSIVRYIVKDPGWDFLITIVLSLCIALVVVLMNAGPRVDDPVYITLLDNKSYIDKLRQKGKSDEEIAASFIGKLNENGLIKKLAYRKAIRYLKRI